MREEVGRSIGLSARKVQVSFVPFLYLDPFDEISSHHGVDLVSGDLVLLRLS